MIPSLPRGPGLADQLRDGAAALGVSLTDAQLHTFFRYLDLLRHWNRRARLTALTEDEAAIHLHFLDSLAVVRAGLPARARVVDVGSGAGFPGIPLAIARSDLRLALIEPAARKAAFLELATRDLGLQITVRQDRAEVAGQDPQWRGQFDVATARAVARALVLTELLLPFVREGGKAVMLKGPSGEAEAAGLGAAASALGGGTPEVVRITLRRGERRVLIVIPKVSPTPDDFPRRAGVPSRRPLSR